MSGSQDSFQHLFEAARNGDSDRLFRLIDSDPTLLNAADSNVNTPLLIALNEHHLDLAEELIKRGANVFAMNHSDNWAMKVITRRNGLKAPDRKRFVEIAIAAKVWHVEIFHAVWRRDHHKAQEILQHDREQISVRLAEPGGGKGFYNTLPWCGLTPLHYAVLAGDKRMVRLLLEQGAEVDAVPQGYEATSYHTPLMMVPSGCHAIAQLLIDHGANPRHSTTYLTSGSKALRKVVIANGAAGTPLMTALFLRDFKKANELALDPESINDRLEGDTAGTPLHLAARVGCHEVIERLIGHGMDVDTPGPGGDTALAMAPEMYCSFETIKLLVDLGADFRIDDDKPLYYAVWQHAFGHWDYEKVIRFLAAKGSHPRGLLFCAQAGNLSAAKLLIELGADVNDTNDDDWPGEDGGFTPLDYCTGVAGSQRNPALARFLREHGGRHSSELT